MKSALISSALLTLATIGTLSAQTFPLSENTWQNPEFVSRFLGSYGFNTSVNPAINAEEAALFEQLVPVIQSQPAKAIEMLRAAIKPDSSPALIYTLANLYFQTGKLADAETQYKAAIKRFPNFLRAYKNLATLYVQNARYKDALPMLLKTIELGGEGGDVYGLLGYSYLNTGDDVAGLRSYEQALLFQPDSRDWRTGRVQALMNLNRAEESIGLIDDLVQKYPNQSDLLLIQANAFLKLKRPLDAAATLEILRARGAASSASMILLGDIYLNFTQPESALEAYKDGLKLKDFGNSRLLMVARHLADARAWSQLDGFLAAIDRKALMANPSDELKLLNLEAESDLAQNRSEAAAVKLAAVVARDPLNGRALLLLAEHEWKGGNIEKATIYFERAARISDIAPDAYVQHARMLVSQRDYAAAVKLLERAQSLRPLDYIAGYLEKVSAAARSLR